MNVLFHLAAGASIIAAQSTFKNSKKSLTGLTIAGFALGIISHGMLDYIPHCYPVNSIVDAILGLCIILLAIWKVNSRWRIMIIMTLSGTLFPDLIDLAPGIINNIFGIQLPIPDKVFPWHYHEYSGSIYSGSCRISTINHILVLLTVAIITWFNWKGLRNIYSR